MRAVVQRVSEASVEVAGHVVGAIGEGLLVYLGVHPDDNDTDVSYMADKLRHLRIFSDENDKLNLDVQQVDAAVLMVSAFTTQADARKGRRPSFEGAAKGDVAKAYYQHTCDALTALGVPVERGVFGATMTVRSTNAGPLCILLDSKKRF